MRQEDVFALGRLSALERALAWIRVVTRRTTSGGATARCQLIRLATAIAAVAPVVGCMVGPNYRPPETEAPGSWSALPQCAPSTQPATTRPSATRPSVATMRPAELTTWWQGLGDSTLDDLIAKAVESNLDLRVAEWRVRQARAERGIVAGNLFPRVGANAGYSYSGSSLNSGPKTGATTPGLGRQLLSSAAAGALNGVGSALGGGTGTAGTSTGARLVTNALGQAVSSRLGRTDGAAVSRQLNLFQAGFDASWEIDIFGGLRRAVEAADDTIAATEDIRRDTLVTLLSEVAFNYVQLRAFQRRLEIANENIRSQSDTLELTRSRYRAGLTSELDVAQAQAQLATTQSVVPLLESAIDQTIYQLSVLIAQPPGALLEELSTNAPIPVVPREVPIGLPSELLLRRPDVRASERQLAAATAQIGVATADLFPKFFLTGTFGPRTRDIRRFFDEQSLAWSVGPNMQWAIFEGGKIVHNIELQDAFAQEALTVYQRTVLIALQDVESSLVAYADEQDRYHALTQAVAANQRSFELSYELYSRGLTAFLNVLESQRLLYASQDQLVESQGTVVTNLIALYKALGGGWDAGEEWNIRLPPPHVGWPKVNVQIAPPETRPPAPEP